MTAAHLIPQAKALPGVQADRPFARGTVPEHAFLEMLWDGYLLTQTKNHLPVSSVSK